MNMVINNHLWTLKSLKLTRKLIFIPWKWCCLVYPHPDIDTPISNDAYIRLCQFYSGNIFDRIVSLHLFIFLQNFCLWIVVSNVFFLLLMHISTCNYLNYPPGTPIIINILRPRQNGHHFADAILMCIFLNENVWIPIEMSLQFVPKGPISNISALVQIMDWRRSGDKPLSEPMMVRLPTHICVTRPQWVNMT